jgi:hypothetical protein
MGDRSGHRPAYRPLLLALLVAGLAAPAAAADYKAQRFDVTAAVDHGNLDVHETVAFQFLSGSHSRVWRDIPTRHTDGIEILAASMDGHAVTAGDGPGHYSVGGTDDVRIEWHFAPEGPSAHTFALHYLIRGIVYRYAGNDVLRWRALPTEHTYAIDHSRVTIVAPVPTVAGAKVEGHRLSIEPSADAGAPGGVDVQAGEISSNGSLIAELHFAEGSLISAPPRWQQRQIYAASLAPRWAWTGAAVLVIGVFVLVSFRLKYPAASIRPEETTTTLEPPALLPAAIAGALAANGSRSGTPSVATLIDLADRGVLSVEEVAPGFAGRQFELAQVPGKHDLEDHEIVAIATAFAGGSDRVRLSKALSRLKRNGRRFGAALRDDLYKAGLLDARRRAVRGGLSALAFGGVILAAVSFTVTAAFVPQYGAWPFFMPGGLMIAAIIGLLMAASTTPLSDEGLIEAARWRGYRRHLKALAAHRDSEAGEGFSSRSIVYGVALGLAYSWSRYLKRHPEATPRWFVAAETDPGAFAAFIGAHAAAASSGAAGGAAAGGGSSGAS